MKVKIHPLFFVLALYFVAIGRGILLGGYLIAVLMHEVAHARMAKWRGYALGNITIMPYGGVIDGGACYDRADNIWIALAGPAINLILAMLVTASWWLMPASYNYTMDICIANLSLALVNLLPAYPLDGSRIVYALARNKMRAIAILRGIGIALGVGMLALCVVSIWYQFHLSIGIFGMFLVYGAWAGGERNTYLHLTERAPIVKDYEHGVRACRLDVGWNTPLLRLVSRLNPQERYEFTVLDESLAPRYAVSETQLQQLCVGHALTDGIGVACESYFGQKSRPDAENT